MSEVFDYVAASSDTGDYEEEIEGYYDGDTGSIFSSIGKAFKSVGKTIGGAAKGIGKVASSGFKALTNNPIWDIARTGVSFIPGVGTAVSAGMASASAIGRGESLKNIGLAAARGAIPGGPAAQAAFDIAVGAVQGHGLSATALRALRDRVPGGSVGKAAFDAAIALKKGGGAPAAINAIRSMQAPSERAAFDRIVGARPRPMQPSFRNIVSRAGGRSYVIRVPLTTRPTNIDRPFPHLNAPQNRVASALLQTPWLRGLSAARLARDTGSTTNDARAAIAAFLERFGAQKVADARDVGEFESMDACANRVGCQLPSDIGAWPLDDTGAIEAVKLPPVAVTRTLLKSLYERGDDNVKKALLAHELLALVARNTGELVGTTWTIRSGDTASKVAKTVVGDGNRWREIVNANPTMTVYTDTKGMTQLKGWNVGKTIQLPPSWFPSAIPLPAVTESSSSGGPFPTPSEYPLGYPSATYVVREGDNGEKVALRIVGDKSRWRELLTTNPKLAGPHGIELYTGKTIQLPASWVKPQPTPEIISQTQPLPEPETPAPTPIAIPTPPLIVAEPPKSDGTLGSPPPVPPFLGGVVTPPGPLPTPPGPLPTLPGIVDQYIPDYPEDEEPIVTGSAEQVATVQLMLAMFFREHPDAMWADGKTFGTPEDLAGVWTDRTTAAFLSFERWWNAKQRTPALEADGLPDAVAIAALIKLTGEDGVIDVKTPVALTVGGAKQAPVTLASSEPAKKKSSSGAGALLAIGLPLLLSAL